MSVPFVAVVVVEAPGVMDTAAAAAALDDDEDSAGIQKQVQRQSDTEHAVADSDVVLQ